MRCVCAALPPCVRLQGSVSASSGAECLRLKAGAETLAAFFETRRYASYLGA